MTSYIYIDAETGLELLTTHYETAVNNSTYGGAFIGKKIEIWKIRI